MYFNIAVSFLSVLLLSSQCDAAPIRVRAPNGKRGLAKIEAFPEDIRHVANSRISWAYGWKVDPPTVTVPGVEWVPMQWGRPDITEVAGKVGRIGGPKVLLVSWLIPLSLDW